MKTLQVTYLSEYHDEMAEDIHALGLTVLSASANEDYCTVILEGKEEYLDMLEDFMNGETFI